ncbi:hypothetical protein GCM10025868_36540 [Angustibacter aerolatus]|uniref:GGDEF domain-containing protein n=1 Tax=Angustibacter aerolatus TaxID=1162965 RepID=A0ABQ6JM44_9ACTN|nr:hypothetical protein GCM10025868_36540 [Angustibacter aerolatus]
MVAVRRVAERRLGSARVSLQERVHELERARVADEEQQRRFRGVFDASPVGVALADEPGPLRGGERRLVPAARPRARGAWWAAGSREFTDPDDLPQHARAGAIIDAAVDGVGRVEKRFVRPDGTRRWAWLSMAHVPGPDGQVWTLAHAQDVTERKAADLSLRRTQDDLAAVAAVAREVAAGVDARPTVLHHLGALTAATASLLLEPAGADDLVVTATDGAEVVGTRVHLPSTTLVRRAWERAEPVFGARVEPGPQAEPEWVERWTGTSVLVHPVSHGGRPVALLMVLWGEPVDEVPAETQQTVRLLAQEVAVALQAERLRLDLERMAGTDALTGVPNRRAWDDTVQQMTQRAARSGSPLSLAMVDLDHFKRFNDREGHVAGDRLLAEFCRAGQEVLRGPDLLARWGGEEFAVALPDCDVPAALEVLERLRGCVPQGQTCSAGVAAWVPGEAPWQTLDRADTALYRAKQAGRDRIVVAGSSQDDVALVVTD